MKRSRSGVVALMLLAGCGYPLRTPPYLNGEVEGIYCSESGNRHACTYVGAPVSDDILPARFSLRVDTWSKTAYTFSGTLDLDGTGYTVSGKEEGGMAEQHEYLAPQVHLLSGYITATLMDEEGVAYRLEGNSRYGTGGGFSPDREEPSATLVIFLPETMPCADDAPCELGTLRFPGN